MVNEEDHLRMQAIRCGFQLKNAYKLANKADNALEDTLEFAYSPQMGYLTACPTNVGTGMRASAMLHLPALVLDENINKVIQAVNKIGLAVRGLYGEGTEAMGNLFQVSNQTTLGEKEEDIINRLGQGDRTDHRARTRPRGRPSSKKSARCSLTKIGRAFGILSHAYSMNSKEALNFLSLIRLGGRPRIFPVGTPGCRRTNCSWKRSPRTCKKTASKNSAPRNATPSVRKSCATS